MDILGLHPTKTVGFNFLSFKLGNYVFLDKGWWIKYNSVLMTHISKTGKSSSPESGLSPPELSAKDIGCWDARWDPGPPPVWSTTKMYLPSSRKPYKRPVCSEHAVTSVPYLSACVTSNLFAGASLHQALECDQYLLYVLVFLFVGNERRVWENPRCIVLMQASIWSLYPPSSEVAKYRRRSLRSIICCYSEAVTFFFNNWVKRYL